MAVIRGGLLIIGSILLFLSFLAANVFLTFNLSLSYDNVKIELDPIVRELAEKEMNFTSIIVDREFLLMQNSCQASSTYLFSAAGYDFEVPCTVVAQGSDAVVDYSVNGLIDKIYFDKYDCAFWKCAKEKPFVMISQKARDYWASKFYFILVVSLVLVAVMFFLVERKVNLFILVGALLGVAAWPFAKFDWAASLISNEYLASFFTIFFAGARIAFWVSLIAGLILLGIGIVLRFVRWDSAKKKFSRRDVQEIVKKEVHKSKQEVKVKKK